MAIRLRYKIEVSISSSTAEEKDLGNAVYEGVADSQGEGGSWKTQIPVSTTDMEIKLPNVAVARFLLLRTNAKDPTQSPVTIAVKRNGAGNEAIDVVPISGTEEGHFLLSTDSLTSLFATNASASVEMELTFFVAGD